MPFLFDRSDLPYIQQVKSEIKYLNKASKKRINVTRKSDRCTRFGSSGIIAGIVDDIGIVEIIDRELGKHLQEKVSAGQAVKAMILNCMGFLTSPLYLFSEFFAGKATEHLIGEGVTAEHLNESRLGRVMGCDLYMIQLGEERKAVLI